MSNLHIDPTAAVPIWKQIEDGVRALIARQVLAPGDSVPSVRELARELRVNPATVAKAYRQLAAHEVVEVRRGEGTFVSSAPPSLPADERRQRLAQAAMAYAGQAATLGSDRQETVAELERAWDELGKERSR